MKTLYPTLRITDPNFKYVNAASTDIRETFRKFSGSNQESLKPLVAPNLPQNGFVLSAEWFEME